MRKITEKAYLDIAIDERYAGRMLVGEKRLALMINYDGAYSGDFSQDYEVNSITIVVRKVHLHDSTNPLVPK
jgi:hypothetical protein